jgi:lipopolysaccharide/colanic/teichoic acid biosynthesis glycosyltransferase
MNTGFNSKTTTLYRKLFKRLLDVCVAVVLLAITLPLLFFTTILLAVANRGKPFFVQPRPGKDEKIFLLLKFRTMNDRKDASGRLLPDEKRLTRVGRFIRKTSLDELPQLINVLKGEMSLVGPRPLLVEYLPLYTPQQRRRHLVRPGITGWAQVNGRNAISWEQKFELDTWYVDHMSLSLDGKILWLTMVKVFKTEGISQQGHATMPYFEGARQS